MNYNFKNSRDFKENILAEVKPIWAAAAVKTSKSELGIT